MSYTLPRSTRKLSNASNVSLMSISISLKSAGNRLFGAHLLHGFSFDIVWYNSARFSRAIFMSSKSFNVTFSGLSNLTNGIKAFFLAK